MHGFTGPSALDWLPASLGLVVGLALGLALAFALVWLFPQRDLDGLKVALPVVGAVAGFLCEYLSMERK